jgi:DNA-binding CsgD family transcriptional regulator
VTSQTPKLDDKIKKVRAQLSALCAERKAIRAWAKPARITHESQQARAVELLKSGLTVLQIAETMQRTQSTVSKYLYWHIYELAEDRTRELLGGGYPREAHYLEMVRINRELGTPLQQARFNPYRCGTDDHYKFKQMMAEY